MSDHIFLHDRIVLIEGRLDALEDQMADAQASFDRLKAALEGAKAKIAEDFAHLKDLIAAGNTDALAAEINSLADEWSGFDPDPTFPPSPTDTTPGGGGTDTTTGGGGGEFPPNP